MMAVLEL